MHRNLGRKQLGDWIVLDVKTTSVITPTAPTAAPVVSIYDSTGTSVGTTWKMPPIQLNVRTGYFQIRILLTSAFSAGKYVGVVTCTVGGSSFMATFNFTVLANGNAKGAYQSLHHFDCPHFEYLVGQTEDGTIEWRKNPRAST